MYVTFHHLIQIPTPQAHTVRVTKGPYNDRMISEHGVINDEIYQKTMKINWSFNIKHENHIKIELNGFQFCRCIHNWCAEEYGHSVFQTDSIHTIPRYQPVIQFQTPKSYKRTLHHNWDTKKMDHDQ